MPIVSASGQMFYPVIVLQGKLARQRTMADPKLQLGYHNNPPADFLPYRAYIADHENASMKMAIFEQCATLFVHKTHDLRQRHKNILLILDGFRGHISFKALQLIRNNNICFVALPAHSIHLT